MTSASRVALALVLLASSVAFADVRPEASSQFWSWFAAHKGKLNMVVEHNRRQRTPSADAMKAFAIYDELERELHRVDPALTFEIGRSDVNELVVSADGIRQAFPAVEALVRAAPPIKGWKVIAFRPRNPGFAVDVGHGAVLDGSKVEFLVTGQRAGKVDVALFAPESDQFEHKLIFLVLDGVLGEYDVETRIGAVDVLPTRVAPANARPLHELVKVVDALK